MDSKSSQTVLLSYFQKASHTVPAFLNSNISFSETAYFPVTVALLIHSLRVAYDLKKTFFIKGRMSLWQEAVVMMVYSFGGSAVAALLLGLPQPWLESNLLLPMNFLVYWSVAFMPGDLLFNFLQSFGPYTDLVLSTLDGLVKGYSISTGGVDLVKYKLKDSAISSSLVAMLVIGAITGHGGGLVADIFSLQSTNWRFQSPSIFNAVPLDFKASILSTVVYILTARLWTFSSAVPNFPLSEYLDNILFAFIPKLTNYEAKLVVGSICASLLGFKAFNDSRRFFDVLKAKKASKKVKKN
ncbi:hypothetical protein AYI69_g11124 [Smittium culicis]|uniref:Uncharacterized protein n=1 Tax=Smittium culicis TaxID=133412 RepID=A0A1R1X0Z9_9FUNG|nr:hypothetical protein AYI69_g11124 [Smittium culicis]